MRIAGIIKDLNPAYNAQKLAIMAGSGLATTAVANEISRGISPEGVLPRDHILVNPRIHLVQGSETPDVDFEIDADTAGVVGASLLGVGLNIAGRRFGGRHLMHGAVENIGWRDVLRTGGDILSTTGAGLTLGKLAPRKFSG